MHDSHSSLWRVLLGVLVLCVLSMFVICVVFDSFLEVEPIDDKAYVLLSDGWDIYVDDELLHADVTLPYLLNVPVQGEVVRLVNTLPDPLPIDNACFTLNLGMGAVDVSVDGQNLYRYAADASPWKVPFYGGAMPHFVRIPPWGAGREIAMELRFNSSNSLSKSIPAPALGTKISTLFWQLDREWLSLVFGYTFCFIGIVCLFAALALRKGNDYRSFLSFGWLELTLGVWVITQGKSKFLFIRNPAIPMDLSFLAMFMLPVFLADFLVHTYHVGRSGTILKRISYIFPVMYCFIGVLQLLGVVLYADCLMIGGAALGLFIVAMLTTVIVQYRKGNRRLGTFVLALSVLFLSVATEELLLILGVVLNSATVLHFGMALCGGILLVQVFKNVTSSNRNRIREQMLLEMAYTDALTGFGNRAAYDQSLKDRNKKTGLATGIIIMDLNDLKVVNDTYGHDTGDRVLHDFATKLLSLLPEDADPYRIGGDEFAVFVSGYSPTQLCALADEIERYFVKNSEFGSSVAVGCCFHVHGKGTDIMTTIRKADDAMYICKARMKGADKYLR